MSKKGAFNLQGASLLSGFISSAAAAAPQEEEGAVWIPIEQISPGEFQQRRYFSQEKIDSLAQRFKEMGFRGVLNVRKKGDSYELVAGERRWRAAMAAGLSEVLCLVDNYTDEEALEFGLIENLQREDLSKLEETEGILKLMEVRLSLAREDVLSIIRTEGHSDKADEEQSSELQEIQAILQAFDIDLQTFRTKHLRTLDLPPELAKAHLEKNLSYTIALELNKLQDPDERAALLKEVLKQGLSFREVKERVRALREPEKSEATKQLNARLNRIKREGSALKGKKRKELERLLSEIEALFE